MKNSIIERTRKVSISIIGIYGECFGYQNQKASEISLENHCFNFKNHSIPFTNIDEIDQDLLIIEGKEADIWLNLES